MTGKGLPTAAKPVPTSAQRRFAATHHASVGLEATCPTGARFVYGRNCIGLVRWLVDRDGAILDRVRLD